MFLIAIDDPWSIVYWQVPQTEDNAIRMKLEATGAGGVHISAIGASWLFVGIILSTAATEIAALLK